MPIARALRRRPPSRSRLPGGLLAAALSALVAPAAASAATLAAESRPTGLRATLDGARLTISAGEAVSGSFLRSVQGQTVQVACVSGLGALLTQAEDIGEDVLPAFDVSALGGPAAWPAADAALVFDLPRDVSASADACLVAGSRGDLAPVFGFSDVARLLSAEYESQLSLALAHSAAKQAARARRDRRFPSARVLARAVAASEPQLDVRLARDARAVRRDGSVYVLRRGTTDRRVRLAYRSGGSVVTADGRRRGALATDGGDFDPTEILSGERGRFGRG